MPAEDGVDGLKEIGAKIGFGDEGLGAGGTGGADDFPALVHGEDENRSAGEGLADALGSGDAVEDRHGDVEHDEIRMEFDGLVDRFGAIRSFTDNFEVFAGFQERAEALANNFVIIRDQDASRMPWAQVHN